MLVTLDTAGTPRDLHQMKNRVTNKESPTEEHRKEKAQKGIEDNTHSIKKKATIDGLDTDTKAGGMKEDPKKGTKTDGQKGEIMTAIIPQMDPDIHHGSQMVKA